MRYIIALMLTSTAALAEVPRVVTDIPPVHAIVAMVMGDLGTPDLLLGKGVSEHGFQLRPSQVAALAQADLVVWIGPELTPWLETALEARGGDGAVLGLLDDAGTSKISYDVGEIGATEGKGAGGAPAAEAGPDEAADDDHGAIDPHAWLDPSTARYWTGLIAAELSRLDPANAATYAANAVTAADAIAAAEAEARALLDPVKDRPFVTFHDAYGYFIGAFDLTPAGTVALGDAASPGAARLSGLRATMEGGSVPCIFPEAQYDLALVTRMAEGTGARIGGVLDPVGSTLEPGPGAYTALITGMARTLAECLAG